MTIDELGNHVMNTCQVPELNEIPTECTLLLLLRCLVSSDKFTTTYMLLEKRTISDIADTCEGVFNDLDSDGLNDKQKAEYVSHVNELKQFVKNIG